MKKKICLILADYYPDISNMLLEGSFRELQRAEKQNIIEIGDDPIHVPGIFEIPVTISKLIKKYDAFVVLGCVIKGKTPHFNLISKAVINAIMDLSIRNKKPIGNGIITCLNKKQAVERADPDRKNKGGEAVTAVLATLANF
ncbi:MAG: 6,7-dimethyl-8-ribityllumazine synthase [Candidatus Pelagibacter sp.]|jgi:6,7-dimethyl-8-ribityllumazine synthase|nr:6,7-dimethyl-8-ribityllumazine synthase [Candidatus Pelagibacter sp.]|tara:strand:- start:2853 stop:3278 length:426 start_codon:yes stop_codon:yes gene_type:complete